ncbi:MAG: GNAT family N-acetyltransferase, partial [Deltaproteobacteria bacterium]|nr:GNAT family N-acetyltransferase [Deltaproteobacteria bacterium]
MILRDGSTATVRTTRPDDKKALTAFFGSLSDQSKIQRFFSRAVPSARFIESFCDCSNPRAAFSLVVFRLAESKARIIAAGSYIGRNETTAEIALTVDDAFQGKGIGTLLLERLALLA